MNFPDDTSFYVGWFLPPVKPVHVGVYETFDAGYQHWNGSFWGYWCPTITEAYEESTFRGAYQDVRWRGITRDEFAAKTRTHLLASSPIDTLRALSGELCTASPERLIQWKRFIDEVVRHAEQAEGKQA